MGVKDEDRRGGPETSRADSETLGRFELLELLGEGAMGRVYRARDPQLDREVAIKLLHPTAHRGARLRLIREAQALASLSHPNILPIYDIGPVPDQPGAVYLAMQRVVGRDLQQWLRARPRSRGEILDRFIAAGHGLLAAHEAGLVHRDFKPANVMVDDEGRTLVMDFGLVRRVGEEPSTTTRLVEAELAQVVDELTKTGAIVGTPAYMAPEQYAGGTLDARTDQFAFCIALWEALYGERPFPEKNMAGMVHAKSRGRYATPKGRRLPRQLHAALLRGLSPDPALRFPSLDPLLDLLRDIPRKERRRLTFVLAGGGTVALALVGTLVVRGPPTDDPCDDEDDAIAATWNDDTRARIGAAFEGTGLGYAPDVWTRLEPRLDDYARGWSAMRADVCAEPTRSGRPLLDERLLCLDGRREHLQALVETLAHANDAVVEGALEAIEDLPTLEPCADASRLSVSTSAPDDPALQRRMFALRSRLSRAAILGKTGQRPDALAMAMAVAEESEDDALASIRAAAAHQLGELYLEEADYPAAQQWMTEAYFLAEARDDAERAGLAALRLSRLSSELSASPEDGLRWYRHAEAVLAPLDDARLSAQLQSQRGFLWGREFQTTKALDAYLEALALQRRVLPPDDLQLAQMLQRVSHAQFAAGAVDDAMASNRECLEIETAALGPRHPRLAHTHNMMGIIHTHFERYDQARQSIELAISIFEDAHGPDHLRLASLLNSLSHAHFAVGRYDQAIALQLRALTIRERVLDPLQPVLAGNLEILGNFHIAAGRQEQALAYHRRALSITQQNANSRPRIIAHHMSSVGEVLTQLGRFEEASPVLEEATRLLRSRTDPVPDVGLETEVAYMHGIARLGLRDTAGARSHFDRVLAAEESNGFITALRISARFQRLRVRELEGEEPASLLPEARRLRARLDEMTRGQHAVLAEIDQWIATATP